MRHCFIAQAVVLSDSFSLLTLSIGCVPYAISGGFWCFHDHTFYKYAQRKHWHPTSRTHASVYFNFASVTQQAFETFESLCCCLGSTFVATHFKTIHSLLSRCSCFATGIFALCHSPLSLVVSLSHPLSLSLSHVSLSLTLDLSLSLSYSFSFSLEHNGFIFIASYAS